jgi:hypothetical protein
MWDNVTQLSETKLVSYYCYTVIIPQKAEGTKEDHWRDFWMCKTVTGQQVAQLLDSYKMMIYHTSEL